MIIRRSNTRVQIDLTPTEAQVLLDELSNVRGGSRLPKLRQVCAQLDTSLKLTPRPPAPKPKPAADLPAVQEEPS